jgi:malonate decarboxylase beta subunit
MSIAAGLCSYLLVTQEARLGLNGPQVIEQEAGIEEYDSRDRPFIWSFTGGEQRFASELVDGYAADDVAAIQAQVEGWLKQGRPASERSGQYTLFLERLLQLDTTAQIDPQTVRRLYRGEPQ